MKPEEEARKKIDQLLTNAGWIIQDRKRLNLRAGLGVAVREFSLNSGPADYLLFIDGKMAGVIEAKKFGYTLGGVAEQSAKYAMDLPKDLPRYQDHLPFVYESTGIETFFRDLDDPNTRSRRIFAFHQPVTLLNWLVQRADQSHNTLRARIQRLPEMNNSDLRACQAEAIARLFESLQRNNPRALIQMATGSGKTYTAVSFIYWLIKFAGAKRVLFLVDRRNLAGQTAKEFQQYQTPDDGRKFTDLYNVQFLTGNSIDPAAKVCITTIQRLYSILKGEVEFDGEQEDLSLFDDPEVENQPVKEVVYNAQIPLEMFDFIVTDECHRSIYNVWRQALEYFDAFLVGLTATPSKQTLGYFNQNLVMEYSHERAVADGVNVGYQVYRIKTKITEQGSLVEADLFIDKRDRKTRQIVWEKLDEDLAYKGKDLDRSVVAIDQIRTVIQTFKDKLFTDIFPGRWEVPKTLIFAKDDNHAEDILHIVREVFGEGNDFCKKVTYRTTGEKTDDLIASFRNSYNPRIVVTVDMIATGTDIKPLECLLFMRDVKSQIYFEQMKGRGTRTINRDDFQAITRDANSKDHFVIVDAVGVCESDKNDSRPLDRKPSVAFDKLLDAVAVGKRSENTLLSLGSRLARLGQRLNNKERQQLVEMTGGVSIEDMTRSLLDAFDRDYILRLTRQELSSNKEPTVQEQKQIQRSLIERACAVFDDPDVRDFLANCQKNNQQVIDQVSKDQVLQAGFMEQVQDSPEDTIDRFKRFMEVNRDELTALQIFYNRPYGQRMLTLQQVKELAESLKRPPFSLTSDVVWRAYAQLENSRVKGANSQRLLTDIIALIRFGLGEVEVLEPYSNMIEDRFRLWVEQENFTEEQVVWLNNIKDHIVTSVSFSMDDLDVMPREVSYQGFTLFGNNLVSIIDRLNTALAA